MISNSTNQYLELWRNKAEAIDAGSAEPLNRLRPVAAEALERSGGLPGKAAAGFEQTSLADMFAPDFGVNINRLKIPTDPTTSFRCGVPNLSTLLCLVINDSCFPTSTMLRNMPDGLTVCSLAEAAHKMPELVESYYGKAANMADASVALNTMLVQDGVFIHVGRGVKVAKALQIVSILNSPSPLAAFRRIVVVADEDSEISILKCDHTQGSDVRCLSSEVVEIYAAHNARVDWYDIEESNSTTSRRHQIYARQAEASNLLICAATLTNGTTRNDFNIDVSGQHAETTLAAMVIGSGNQHVDNSSSVRHHADNGHSRQLFKYVLDGHASGAFEGCIEVCPGARFVEAYQTNKNIIASAEARMHTNPALLIYNDDVKCSHGASTGQLDDNALFYMQTRGIPLPEARNMLMQAFMVDVTELIRLEPLRDRLRHLIDCRLAGEQTMCRDCQSENNANC